MEEKITILQFLKTTKQAMSRQDMRTFNVDSTRMELRGLERAGLITKEEKYLHNSGKPYLNNKDKIQTAPGTKVYLYKAI